tara:strand:+ start:24585 stop:25682 length:1098 start_codon:yes stop_codon:yes gene_type:complete
MSKSLILYENDNFKNIFKSKKFLNYKGTSFDIIKSSIYNPPFFKNFIYENPISNDDIKIAWNSTLKNGYLIIPIKFTKYLPNRKYKTVKLLNKLFAVFYKSDSETLIIYDKYRIIDFMIIGVEKGGTTSLHTNISKHPDINMAKPKHHVGAELHYFDYHCTKKNKDIEWFKSHFDYKYKLVGSKNPNTIYLDHTHPFISRLNPYIKMILVLRNPIDRAYSEWHMFNNLTKFNVKNPKSFEDAINEELNYRIGEMPNFHVSNMHHLQRGLYYKQIKKLFNYFPKQNVCIILNDELKNNEKKTYEKIYNFLNVKIIHPNYEKKLEGKYSKNQKDKDINPALRKKMITFFKSDVKKLENLLNLKTNWF